MLFWILRHLARRVARNWETKLEIMDSKMDSANLTDGHTCSLPLGNTHYISEKTDLFQAQNWIWNNQFFWLSLSILHKPKLKLILGVKIRIFCIILQFIFLAKNAKKVMDVFRIKFNIILCKMDNECHKSEFSKSHFVGERQNFMSQKCAISR